VKVGHGCALFSMQKINCGYFFAVFYLSKNCMNLIFCLIIRKLKEYHTLNIPTQIKKMFLFSLPNQKYSTGFNIMHKQYIPLNMHTIRTSTLQMLHKPVYKNCTSCTQIAFFPYRIHKLKILRLLHILH